MWQSIASSKLLFFAWQPLASAQGYWEKPLEAGEWVGLPRPLSPFSQPEALLLCQSGRHLWLAWVPGYGEALLATWQFSRCETQR
jgi:hypothetical protein